MDIADIVRLMFLKKYFDLAQSSNIRMYTTSSSWFSFSFLSNRISVRRVIISPSTFVFSSITLRSATSLDDRIGDGLGKGDDGTGEKILVDCQIFSLSNDEIIRF